MLLANGLVVMLPLLLLVADRIVSIVSFLFLLVAMFSWKQGAPLLRSHLSEIRWVLIAFLLNLLCVLASFLLRQDEPLSSLEQPFRMLAAASALLCVLVLRPRRKSLWLGLMGGAVLGLVFVSYQRWVLDIGRPGGLISAITFGDLALLMGLLSLVAMIDLRQANRWHANAVVVLAALAALAGVAGSVVTGTRGGWVALAGVLLLFAVYGRVFQRKTRLAIGAMCLVVAAALGAAYLVPDSGMRQRIVYLVNDFNTYRDGGVDTSVGIRFELWKGALMLLKKHPLTGAGIASVESELAAEVAGGRLDPLVLTLPHMHNDAIQMLLTGGILGMLAWLATMLAPLGFFLGILNRHASASRAQLALALAGALVVVCYLCFGLTEVIFWTMQSSLFYALMIFILMGLCLNAKENDGK